MKEKYKALLYCILLVLFPLGITFCFFNYGIRFHPNTWLFSPISLIIISSLIFLIFILLAMRLWKIDLQSIFSLPPFKLIFIIVFLIFFIKTISPLANPFRFIEDLLQGKLLFLDYNKMTFSKPYLIISTVVLSPFIEEILFRRIIFVKIKEHFGVILAFVISSILFAFSHLGSLDYVKMFVYGLVYCYIFYRTKSILLSIIAHSFFNLIALNATVLEIQLSGQNYLYLLWYVFGIAVVLLNFKLLKVSTFGMHHQK